MSRIERFLARPKKIKLKGDVLEVKPLDVKTGVPILAEMEKNPGEGLRQLIMASLELIFPDSTLEEREQFSFEHLMELFDVIMEVNNLKAEGAKAAFFKRIKDAQSKPK